MTTAHVRVCLCETQCTSLVNKNLDSIEKKNIEYLKSFLQGNESGFTLDFTVNVCLWPPPTLWLTIKWAGGV